MRNFDTDPRTSYNRAVRSFTATTRAADPLAHFKMASVFVIAMLTVIAAGIISMNSGNATQSMEMTNLAPKGNLATKTDRISTAAPIYACEHQAWGAWSSDCAAKLGGASHVRTIGFETIERPASAANQTVLTRVPVAN